MARFGSVIERRLGIHTMWADHTATWSTEQGSKAKVERRRTLWYFLLTPTIIAALPAIFRLPLNNVAQILAGTAVFTGLLFGLLGVVFNMGVTLRKEGEKFPNAHGLPMTISDLRANITYAIAVGVLLNLSLVLAAVLTPTGCAPSWLWTVAVSWLFAHLGLTLLMVLKRFRTAFNYITR